MSGIRFGGRGRGGRGGSRGGRGGGSRGGRGGGKAEPPSADDLDAELDAYRNKVSLVCCLDGASHIA